MRNSCHDDQYKPIIFQAQTQHYFTNGKEVPVEFISVVRGTDEYNESPPVPSSVGVVSLYECVDALVAVDVITR